MSPEAAVLGLLSAARVTPLAAVYALLTAGGPRRLLSAYIAAGSGVSLVVGIAVVSWFGATAASAVPTTARQIVYVVCGVGALAYAVGSSGWIGGGARDRPARGLPDPDGRLGRRLRHPSLADAAAAGVVTNLPGLFYVAGLAAILETRPGPVNGVVQVVIFNALRFSVPIAALLLVVLRREATRTVVDTIQALVRRHSRVLIMGVSGAVGIYLSVKGLVGLLA